MRLSVFHLGAVLLLWAALGSLGQLQAEEGGPTFQAALEAARSVCGRQRYDALLTVVAIARAEASSEESGGSATAKATAEVQSLIDECIAVPAAGSCPEECAGAASQIGEDCVGAFVASLSLLDLKALGYRTAERLTGVAKACGWKVPEGAKPAGGKSPPSSSTTSDARLAELRQAFSDACDDQALAAVTSATAEAGAEVSAEGGTGAASEAQSVEQIPLAACFRYWSRSGGTECPPSCQEMARILGAECTARFIDLVSVLSSEQLPGAPPTEKLTEACGW